MPIFLDEQMNWEKRGIGYVLLKRSALIKAFVTFFQYIAINFFIYKF